MTDLRRGVSGSLWKWTSPGWATFGFMGSGRSRWRFHEDAAGSWSIGLSSSTRAAGWCWLRPAEPRGRDRTDSKQLRPSGLCTGAAKSSTSAVGTSVWNWSQQDVSCGHCPPLPAIVRSNTPTVLTIFFRTTSAVTAWRKFNFLVIIIIIIIIIIMWQRYQGEPFQR